MSILSGEQIKHLREQLGWEQRALAAAAHIHPSVVSRLERNLQEDVNLSVAVALATALGVSVDNLLATETLAQPDQPLAPVLQSVISDLGQRTEAIQLQAAGILRGYLSTL